MGNSDYENGALFSGNITKSILRKKKVVKIKRKKVVKIKKNKMLVQRSKNRNKSKRIKHGKKLFGGSVTKVKQRQVRNIPSYSTRSLNNTSNRNNNYRTTSKLSLSKVLSTARQLTPVQKSKTANCINYVFNIIGGPRGPIGPAGNDGATGGATAECNGYFIDQNLRTTDGVTFNSVEATTSYSLAGVPVTSTEWGYLANMDQDVNTTSNVTFNSVTATTSYSLGSTTIDATQWNRLATIDQDLSTTDDVDFNSVTIADGQQLNLISSGQVYITSPSDTTMEFYILNTKKATLSNTGYYPGDDNTQDLGSAVRRWKNLYVNTSIDLGGIPIGTTQWNYLASVTAPASDQSLNSTDDVQFNSVTVPYNTVNTIPTIRLNTAATVGFFSPDVNTIAITINGTRRQNFDDDAFYNQQDNFCNLGRSNKQWKDLYLSQKANVGQLNISNPTVPASAAAAGTAGDIAWDADYIYVCIAASTWKRAPLSSWP